jgi:signal transduction histidine kinase
VCNLVENALAHTPPGGAVSLASADTGTTTVVTVTDTGSGIPAADLAHVFDRFYRADPARASGGRNVGLGLPIVRSIVDLHGGTVGVTSEAGKGTRVTMSFPKMAKP